MGKQILMRLTMFNRVLQFFLLPARMVVTQDYVPGHWPGQLPQDDDPSQHDYELTLHKGETLVVLEQTDSFTWLGYKDGKLGHFPSCCVQVTYRQGMINNKANTCLRLHLIFKASRHSYVRF